MYVLQIIVSQDSYPGSVQRNKVQKLEIEQEIYVHTLFNGELLIFFTFLPKFEVRFPFDDVQFSLYVLVFSI